MALFCTDYSLGLLGLRDGRWKLIHELESGRSRLYDLEDDPEEREDLAGTPPGACRGVPGTPASAGRRPRNSGSASRGRGLSPRASAADEHRQPGGSCAMSISSILLLLEPAALLT